MHKHANIDLLIKLLGALFAAVFVVTCAGWFWAWLSWGDLPPLNERIETFRDLPVRSQGLIAAIKRFHTDNGRPPHDLQELVPKYLPAIPDTGVARFPTYDYRVFPHGGMGPLVWYDLGPAEKNGAPGQAKYGAIGPPGQAILVVEYYLENRVDYAETVRLTSYAGGEAFDPERWRSDKLARRRMVASFLRDVYPKMKTLQDLAAALGAPDGKGVLWETPWELEVRCFWRYGNLDHLIYWPTQRYDHFPAQCFPVGDWLYVRDDL
jgi:hypothetical protein